MPGGQTEEPGRPLTPAQANAQLSAFNLDEAKQKALFDDKHPSHKTVLAERTQAAGGGQPAAGDVAAGVR